MPISPPWFDHPNNILWRVQIMNHLSMKFSSAFCHFIPVRSKYSPQHPFLKHPQSVFFSYCESASFTSLQHNILQYLHFKAFPRNSLLLISSWMQFWFITIIPKLLNFTFNIKLMIWDLRFSWRWRCQCWSSALKMDTVCFSETFVHTYNFIQGYNSEDQHQHSVDDPVINFIMSHACH
jgi:hypothetical protein